MKRQDLSAFTADATSQLDVLRHDGYPLGVDGTKVGVFKETDQVGLAGLLQGHHSRALEAEVRLEVLRDLPHQPLEGQLADEQLSRLLVTTNLTQRDRARPVAMRLLDSTGCRSTLPGGLGSKLLARCFSSRALAGGLLRTGHSENVGDDYGQ
ncbi:hypothetical protein ANAPC2_01294 [Anaplasma phagocytophilum]|nr:hypothetical protein ANAPC2_01294 [Anaplasma phagocytophilum]